ncbi:MAG: cob(I)yrinic acid a,c-diamide adenosyltransferase [Candidatus Dadabacteria bacterium]|nr:MAG: cob(I)yrinic acid a,c-diamide adenosyltransferase [Candidatus Dadabacteria bacterium]
MARRGLVIVHTGPGKGKTTAALGLALRAVGQGLRVAMVQFIKGSWKYGELKAPEFLPGFEITPMGRGFVNLGSEEPDPQDVALARETLAAAREKLLSGRYDMVILDEINYAVDYGLVPVEDVLRLIREKPQGVHLVLTGRNARPEVIEAADLVTEMREIKHPFREGVKAQKGIEF